MLELDQDELDVVLETYAAAGSPRAPFVAGVFDGLPAEYYHAVEALSSSGIDKLLRSPQHFRLYRDRPNPPTPQMQFGTAVHCGILEPWRFDDACVRAPLVNKRTNAGKAEWSAFVQANAGRVILAPSDYERARRCIDAVRSHPAAAQLLDGAETEKSLFWIDGEYNVPCKARFDAWHDGMLIDVKTTVDASSEEFAKTVANFGYDVQAWFYSSGAEHVLNVTPDAFVFIVVESEPPHSVACYELGHASILAGKWRADLALERYAAALAAGEWCGYPRTIERIETPAWRRRIH